MEKQKKKLENKEGITLIALVITIIVLLILAGVAINSLVGENGLVKKAEDSREATDFANAQEKLILLLQEYKMRITSDFISFYDYFLEKKQSNEIQDIFDNYDGTYWIEIDDYEFLVRAKDLMILEKNKITGERPSATHEFIKEQNEGKIILHASINDSQGILQITNPDNTVVKYENQEKEVSIEYPVKYNGRYVFVIEAGNGRKSSHEVQITELALFNERYEASIDYQNVEQIYETVKEEQTEEETNILNQASQLGYNVNMLASEKNEANDSWTIWGQSKTNKLDGYYIYDKYNVNTTTTYTEGPWTAWQSSNFQAVSNTRGYKSYTFNSSTGVFTVSGLANFNPYDNVHRYGPLSSTSVASSTNVNILTEYWTTSSKYGSPKYQRTKQAIPETTQTKGSYLTDVLLLDSYPEDGVKDGFWYTKQREANQYYSYKFRNNAIKSTYDPIKKVIETESINLYDEMDKIKLFIQSDKDDYKVWILDASENWKEITDHSGLDAGKEIQLSEKSNKIKIRIELNSSTINQIMVDRV